MDKEIHLDTIDDLLKLIETCHNYDNKKSRMNRTGLDVTSEKLDELKHYTSKLKRFVSKQ